MALEAIMLAANFAAQEIPPWNGLRDALQNAL
jgi:hypothetical protein